MKHTKTALHMVFSLLTAAFLTACASLQGDGGGSDYGNYGGGHAGHH